jgi:hypothetical protein
MSARHRDPRASDLERENERLRRELADREQQIHRQAEQIAEQKRQIADAEKQIGDLERQLALRKQNQQTPPSRRPPMDWPVNRDSGAGAKRVGARWVDNLAIAGHIGPWCPSPKWMRFGPSYRISASTAVTRCPRRSNKCRLPGNRNGIK